MRLTTVKIGADVGLALAVFALGVIRQAGPAPAQASTSTAGGVTQDSPIPGLSQGEYVKIGRLGRQTGRTHTISDADLDWDLGVLRGGKNAIVRARAMTVLWQTHPMSPAQKAKILPAITPYLNSTDRLDQLGAQRVRKAASIMWPFH